MTKLVTVIFPKSLALCFWKTVGFQYRKYRKQVVLVMTYQLSATAPSKFMN